MPCVNGFLVRICNLKMEYTQRHCYNHLIKLLYKKSHLVVISIKYNTFKRGLEKVRLY